MTGSVYNKTQVRAYKGGQVDERTVVQPEPLIVISVPTEL